jgi:hypothetical protein
MSRPCNPEHYFIGNGFTGCTDEEFDIMRIWCSMISNHQPLESLYKVQYSDEFKNIIDELRKSSFKLQTEYLEKVFEMIDRNDDELIRTYLKKNEKSSYDWCIRFNVPIYVQRHRSIEESHSDLQDSSQSE